MQLCLIFSCSKVQGFHRDKKNVLESTERTEWKSHTIFNIAVRLNISASSSKSGQSELLWRHTSGMPSLLPWPRGVFMVLPKNTVNMFNHRHRWRQWQLRVKVRARGGAHDWSVTDDLAWHQLFCRVHQHPTSPCVCCTTELASSWWWTYPDFRFRFHFRYLAMLHTSTLKTRKKEMIPN